MFSLITPPSSFENMKETHNMAEMRSSFNSQAQKFKRQEILQSKRRNFTPEVLGPGMNIEDPDCFILELAEIMNRTFNTSLSNTHKNKNMKKILIRLRDILHGNNNEKLTPAKNFDLYLQLLITILRNNPTDILYESLRNISLLTFHSHLFDSSKLITPLLELVEVQEKKLNMMNANIVLEKILFSIGNLALESNVHHELLMKSRLAQITLKLLYRNDINLLSTALWMLSNLLRNTKEDALQMLVNTNHFYKVVMHLLNKFNENNNALLISELLWMLVIISNNSTTYELFDPALILKITAFMPSQNIKVSIPTITILANLTQFLGENCLEIVKNVAFQSIVEKILFCNVYILKRELVFLLSNFVAVDSRIAEFFIMNVNLMTFISNMFWELKENIKDDILNDLSYFFLNMVSHKLPNTGKILTENYPRVIEVFNFLANPPINQITQNQNLKNFAKAFFSLIY